MTCGFAVANLCNLCVPEHADSLLFVPLGGHVFSPSSLHRLGRWHAVSLPRSDADSLRSSLSFFPGGLFGPQGFFFSSYNFFLPTP